MEKVNRFNILNLDITLPLYFLANEDDRAEIFQYVQTDNGRVVFHPNESLVISSANEEDEGYYR